MILNVVFEGNFVVQLKRSCVQTLLARSTGHGVARRGRSGFLLLLILLINSMVCGLKCESPGLASQEDPAHVVVDVSDDVVLVSTT